MLLLRLIMQLEHLVKVAYLCVGELQLGVGVVRGPDPQRLHPVKGLLRIRSFVLLRACLQVEAEVSLSIPPLIKEGLKRSVDTFQNLVRRYY